VPPWRVVAAIKGAEGKRLMYREPTTEFEQKDKGKNIKN